MFSWPESHSDFVALSLKTVPHVALINGILFFISGINQFYSASSFVSRAEQSSVTVVTVESRKADNGMVYRPLLEAIETNGRILRFSGNRWVSPKPHDEGEIVDGFVDWTEGETRSVSMIRSSKAFGGTFAGIGGISFALGGRYILRRRSKSALVK